MESPEASEPLNSKGKNIVIFSDGTGQRGGVYVDETRTNVYKLFRATRVGPDTNIDPGRQLAFYDPGLGTQPSDGLSIYKAYRTIYNFVSQATGLGITHNIIDCYAAIIDLWRPGDRIYLFGFSRGAYTVRCLASVLCYCGIPSRGKNDSPLRRGTSATSKIAAEAVKGVYQHVSSSRDAQYFEQRKELAEKFCSDYQCGKGGQSEFPFFVGVFDTVAALSNPGSLFILGALLVVLLLVASAGAAWISPPLYGFGYWFGWFIFDAFLLMLSAYVYTHLKFSFRLSKSRWWETVHLTTFRQKFYDNMLDIRIPYARHAISIDERRSDFARVKWGNHEAQWGWRGVIDHFQQVWFAGNHSDIGGGYPENESRLSDIAFDWIVGETQKLGAEALLIDYSILQLKPSCEGPQHDETQSLLFRLAGKSDRELVEDANLHPTVRARFDLAEVLQHDTMAPYRPESLRSHVELSAYYADVPLPRVTCWQALKAWWKDYRAQHRGPARPGDKITEIFAKFMEWRMDRIVSCFGLLSLASGASVFIIIVSWQIVSWLANGVWHPVPLTAAGITLNWLASDWIGLHIIFDSMLRLPLSVVCLIAGVGLFWLLGTVISAKLYELQVRAQKLTATPSQSHA